MNASSLDPWAQLLQQGRFGTGDAQMEAEYTQKYLYPLRKRLLDLAKVATNDIVLDVGCGDGLIGMGALERVGDSGKVIFSDTSPALLSHCQSLAQQRHALAQCLFLQTSAEDLSALSDSLVHVITIRSVLLYVENKQRAFTEFYRVLQAQGRLIIFEQLHNFEPLARFAGCSSSSLFYGFDIRPIQAIADKVQGIFHDPNPSAPHSIFTFDERDLCELACAAGFTSISFTIQAQYTPIRAKSSWEAFLEKQTAPFLPTIRGAIQQALTAREAASFEAYLRPLVEAGQGSRQEAILQLLLIK